MQLSGANVVARMPVHFSLHHMLSNAPRRIIGLVPAGVKSPAKAK